jgi:hypothetical protein
LVNSFNLNIKTDVKLKIAPFLKTKCGIDPEYVYGQCGEDFVWEAVRKDAFIGNSLNYRVISKFLF